MKNIFKLAIFIMIFFFNMLEAKNLSKEHINIGLISIANNKKQITLQSEDGFNFGFYENGGFYNEFKLKDNKLFISKNISGVLVDGIITSSYKEALQKSNEIGGIPIYIGEGGYSILLEDQFGPTIECIALSNGQKNIFAFIQSNDDYLSIQGSFLDKSFPVTKVNDRRYRGTIHFVYASINGITAVNQLPMEEYLYGVIANEMISSWPEESLKAQAVAARSMANYQYARFLNQGYNLVDTTTSQVYKGLDSETLKTNLAVDVTCGEVALYKNQIAETLYFSTSGGYTEDSLNVWGNSIPYLKSKKDIYETNPEIKPWERTITLSDIDKCLAERKINIGSALGIRIDERTLSGRVSKLSVLGSNGEYSLIKEDIRNFFLNSKEGSLKSRLFNIEEKSNTTKGTTENSNQANQLFAISSEDVFLINKDIVFNGKQSVNIVAENNKITVLSNNNEIVVSPNEIVYGDFVLKGKGFGHGVGMSQSGALGMGELGFNYKEILKFYYEGLEIEK